MPIVKGLSKICSSSQFTTERTLKCSGFYFQRSALVANSQRALAAACWPVYFQRSALVANSQQTNGVITLTTNFQRSALVANSQPGRWGCGATRTFKDLL